MKSIIFAPLYFSLALATQVVYLSNGQNSYTPCGGNNYQISEMIYYNNIDGSQNGQQPDDATQVGGCGYHYWETTSSGTFGSGVTFTSHIDSGAASYSTGQYAGYGSNGYANFACFKDNGTLIKFDEKE